MNVTEGLLYDCQRDGHIGLEDVLYIYDDGSREKTSRKAADRVNRHDEVVINQEVKASVTDSRERRPVAQRSRVMPGAKHHQASTRRTSSNKRLSVLSVDHQR